VELEKLAHFVVGAPFVAGLADAGGRAAERFRAVAERYERWKMEEKVISEIINAPLNGERPFSKLTSLENLPPPLVQLRRALKDVKDEVEKDAAVVAALVLYKTLINNAGAYRELAGWYRWARGLVEKQEFVVTADKIRELREAQRRLEEAAEEVRRELNAVLMLYASHSRDLYEKLRPHLEVDWGMAEEVAEARIDELSGYGGANMGTKAYAVLLSAARGGIYGHAAMLLMGEGALADIVLSTPKGAYEKAKRTARGRGETVHPSYSRRGAKAGKMAEGRGGAVDLSHVEAAGWEDRAASTLLRFLIGYGEVDLKFRRVEKGHEKGFQVFRTFGGIEAPVGELWIGKVAYFKVSEEELRRRVEEAKRTAPDLSGMDKASQYVAWRNTDVTSSGKQIVATTVHPWQLRWYFGLLGDEQSFSGSASVTKEDIKPFVTARWPREREDQILRESRWLESVLDRRVESWRKLVDAINWSRVLERVGGLADKVKPWIGPEKMSDAEREGLMRKMFSELALLVHFAEARREMDDGRWRKERAMRLGRAVEALSGGRIAGKYAKRLAQAIVYYAEGYKKYAEGLIESLIKELAGVSREEVWGVVEFVLSDMYCLARDCARDEVVRKFVESALELIMLDKALNGKFDIEEARLLFGEMYATALAGDGHVGPNIVMLTVGGELGGGAALLRLAALYLLNGLLSDELKFDIHTYAVEGIYRITTTGEDAVRLKRILAVTAPSAGGEYLSPKFDEFVEAAKVEVRRGDIRPTPRGLVAADLTISEAGVAVKYNVYLRETDILLQFRSTDRSRVELAARLLKLAGVGAEVKREGDKGEWYVRATTDKLAAGGEELREALAEVVKTARDNGWVDAGKAERWLKKLERGRMLMEGWPKYEVKLVEGALVVSFRSTNLDNIKQETQRFREMGLEEGRHFTVKMPEGGKAGYVYIRREGLAYAAWLSVHGSERQRELAAEFVKYILQRAEEKGKNVRKKVEKVEESKAWGSLTLKGFEKEVEVNGRKHMVKVLGWSAELEEGEGGKKLLRIRITAEVGRVEGEHTIVDRVRREYTITFGRRGRNNAVVVFATAKADALGGREADAARLVAVIKALTGREPKVYRMKDGTIKIECYGGHLEGFMRYAELADAIAKWLEEIGRR
jgi:nuclear transport factor 2 (NTF2) superfamily protein